MINKDFSQRHLEWPNCYNARDLGGLPTDSGQQTRFGTIIRSDILSRLNEQGHQVMFDYGVRTVIDLRHYDEVAKYDYPTLAPAVTYHNLPLESFKPEAGALINKAKSRGEVYCIILDHYPDLMATVMQTIIQAPEGGIVLHCHAGKDRTGTVAGLLLRLAGVADELIAADYAESQVRLRPLHKQLVAKAGGEENLGFWSQPSVTEEVMFLMLNHIDEKYGTVESYLQHAGLTPSEITQLKHRLLTS